SNPKSELQIAGARDKFLAPVTPPLAQSTALIEVPPKLLSANSFPERIESESHSESINCGDMANFVSNRCHIPVTRARLLNNLRISRESH
ncbi:hypothetical protein, partial [Edaphobacter aggregans]|uniref:hypothetical protein n=1 Tax=Edaphobacter aggregans TaxID=570835 RepID=UPI001B8012C6